MIVTQDQSPGQQLHSQSSPGDLAAVEGQRNGKFCQNVYKFGQNCKLGHSCVTVTKGRLYHSWVRGHVFVHLGVNVSSSAHNCGCVDGGKRYGSNLSIIFNVGTCI